MGFYSGHPAPATDVITARKQFGQIRTRVAARPDGEVARDRPRLRAQHRLPSASPPPDQGGRPGRLGRALAAKRLAAVAAPVEFAGLDIAAHARGPRQRGP